MTKTGHESERRREQQAGLAIRKLEAGLGPLPQWESLINRVETQGVTVLALIGQDQLVREGIMMRHSAGSYGPVCLAGTSRIFSLQRNGKRTATMEIVLDEGTGNWTIAQVRGPMNRRTGGPEHAAAQETARLYNEAWKKIPK